MSFWAAVGWAIVKIAISVAISYLLAPKPDTPDAPKAAGLDQFDFPTAQVGREFPVLFGNKAIKSQNVVWYGDLGVTPITEEVSTGMFSDTDVTTGYMYNLGVHMVLAHDLELIYKITVDGKKLWSGDTSTNGDKANIDKQSFFGGQSQGGGIKGKMYLERGEATQEPHWYLKKHLGDDIPAFRGVACAVLVDMYLGTSKYIKPWTIWAKQIYDDWYPAKAEIGSDGDMNPAHIIYEVITNNRFGMGYDPADIDETSFTAVADTLYDEGFGLSFLWDHAATIENFLSEVLKHIDASLFTDIHTGKFKLKLIRDDYVVEDLPVFDESNIVEIARFRGRTLEDITNSISIKFWDRETGNEGSITRSDIAMVARMGGTVTTTQQYMGIPNKELAEFVLSRDLRGFSTPHISAEILTDRDGLQLEPGKLFLFSWPRYGVTETVMRVTAVEYGEFGDSSIRVECVEDIFAIASATYSAPPPSGWVSPINEPVPCPVHAAIETPYYKIARKIGQTEAANLADDVGYASIAGVRPSKDTYNAEAYFRLSGGDYKKEETKRCAPYGLLTAGITIAQTDLPISWQRDEEAVSEGDWGMIGSEIVRIDTVGDTNVIVGRGCLDTVPAEHAVDAPLILLQDFMATCNTKYSDGNTVNAKMCPTTGKGTLELADAPEQTITMDSRLIRPYPPARLRLDSLADPDEIIGDIDMAWRHRDRTQQLERSIYDTEDDTNIGPETGTTYSYEVRKASDDTLLDSDTGISGNTQIIANADVGFDGEVNLTLWSVRDGYASWQKQLRSFYYWRNHPIVTEPGEYVLTEDEDYLIIEE